MKFRTLNFDNIIVLRIFFLAVIFIYLPHFVESFNLFKDYPNYVVSHSNYAYGELFINYQGGFIRRGLLGEIYLQIYNQIGVQPKSFFATLFGILYLTQICLLYLLLKKFKNYIYLLIFVIFNPALILFNIYDLNVYMVKDVFINIAILFHAYFVSQNLTSNKKVEEYDKYFSFFLLPLIFVNILIHEFQVFFVLIHILLSFTFYIYRGQNFLQSKTLKKYLILLVPTLAIILWHGNPEQAAMIRESLLPFSVEPHPQIEKSILYIIGSFIKFFVYFSYKDFLNLFASFLLTIFLFFVIFHYLVLEKIVLINFKIRNTYIYFFLPCLLIFCTGWDTGRHLSMFSFHMLSFFLIFDMSAKKIFNTKSSYNSSVFLKKNILIISLFMYVFMWRLTQASGFGGKEQILTIFDSGLKDEIVRLVAIIYNFVDKYIIVLPKLTF